MNFDGLKHSLDDNLVELKLDELFNKFNVTPLEAVKNFQIFARRQWLKRFLAHVELFKLTLDVPGDIGELGVFNGLGLMTWANLLECYCIGSRTKQVFGFENWKGFSEINSEDAPTTSNYAGKSVGCFSPPNLALEKLQAAIDIFDSDRFIPQKPRIKLIHGNIEQTTAEFVNTNPGVRFSILHFDCDIYKPTKVALENLWRLVNVGGVVIFDEYGIHDWPGETQAVDEFFRDKNVKIKCFPWTNSPAGYIVKG